jgi:hypothetical protein
MEVRMESKKGTVLTGIEPVISEIQQRLESQPKDWLKTLQGDPAKFAELEREIHNTFAKLADRVVAGILAEATAPKEFADHAKKK